jgi:hypothetical protein
MDDEEEKAAVGERVPVVFAGVLVNGQPLNVILAVCEDYLTAGLLSAELAQFAINASREPNGTIWAGGNVCIKLDAFVCWRFIPEPQYPTAEPMPGPGPVEERLQ